MPSLTTKSGLNASMTAVAAFCKYLMDFSHLASAALLWVPWRLSSFHMSKKPEHMPFAGSNSTVPSGSFACVAALRAGSEATVTSRTL